MHYDHCASFTIFRHPQAADKSESLPNSNLNLAGIVVCCVLILLSVRLWNLWTIKLSMLIQTDKMPCYPVRVLGWLKVCEIRRMCVRHFSAKYSHQQSGTGPQSAHPLAYSHCTYLDLMCGEGRASCLTFTAFWVHFTRHWRVQTEGDGYRNATRHQHFCQYGSGRRFRAGSSGQWEAKVRRTPRKMSS